jgi:hypothetical protein
MLTIEEKTSTVSWKFMHMLQKIAAAEFALESPLLSPFQSRTLRCKFLTSPFDELRAGFWKRGEREDFYGQSAENDSRDGTRAEYCL